MRFDEGKQKLINSDGYELSDEQISEVTDWLKLGYYVKHEGDQYYRTINPMIWDTWDSSIKGWRVDKDKMNNLLKTFKAELLDSLNRSCDHAMLLLSASYPSEETKTFAIQSAQARKYIETGELIGLDFIKNLAKERGEDIDTLVEKIIDKEKVFNSLYPMMIGKRHLIEKIINNAKTIEHMNQIKVDIENINWFEGV